MAGTESAAQRPAEIPLAPGPKTPDEIELAELEREIAGALREIRARPIPLRQRFAQTREFHRLNAGVLAERDALARKVMAATVTKPAVVPERGPRTPVPGETPEEAEFRDAGHAFATAVEAIRNSGLEPAERHRRMIQLRELNRELLAEQDTRRSLLAMPSGADTPSVFVPRAAVPGESAKEAELRRIENAIAEDFFALRGARRDGAAPLAMHRRVMEKNKHLLARQAELQKELTEAALDAVPTSRATPPASR